MGRLHARPRKPSSTIPSSTVGRRGVHRGPSKVRLFRQITRSFAEFIAPIPRAHPKKAADAGVFQSLLAGPDPERYDSSLRSGAVCRPPVCRFARLVARDSPMAKGKKKLEVIHLVCEETGDQNYTLRRKSGGEKLKVKKYSPRLRKHTLHVEKKK
jgi:large subunit ribosomal protein L33